VHTAGRRCGPVGRRAGRLATANVIGNACVKVIANGTVDVCVVADVFVNASGLGPFAGPGQLLLTEPLPLPDLRSPRPPDIHT
jgi:hypothetical protein